MVSLTCSLVSKTESEAGATFCYHCLARMPCRGSWLDSDAQETWKASGENDESGIWNGQMMVIGDGVVAGSLNGFQTENDAGAEWVSGIVEGKESDGGREIDHGVRCHVHDHGLLGHRHLARGGVAEIPSVLCACQWSVHQSP